jgi:putative endonuclease
MWWVYLLLCADGSFYCGSTNNLEKRFETHKAGKGGKYTKSHPVIKLIYSEQFPDKSAALKREIEIKSWSRAQKIKSLKLNIDSFL